MAYVLSVPLWVWVAVMFAALEAATLILWSDDRKRMADARSEVRRAQANARLWRLLAEGRGSGAFNGKRTRVAPAYHAPRASDSF